MAGPDDVRRYRANLQGEVDSADCLRGARRGGAGSEPRRRLPQARVGREPRTHSSGATTSSGGGVKGVPISPSLRARAMAWLARRFGPSFVLPAIEPPARRTTSTPTTTSRRRSRAGCRPPSAPRADHRGGGVDRPRASPAPTSPCSRGAIAAPAATRCAPRCSAPTTAWSPTSAW